MNWTVYCMGDLPIFRDVINAIAMVFNSSLFNPSTGAGLVLVAMLISLILFAFPAVMGKPLSPFPLIFVFLLYFGGIVPKTTLQIQDIYAGTVNNVDNVPVIVAVPAAIAAAISKGITDNVETAFSTPSQGTYLSLGAEGFVNPLKTLLAFRNVGATSNDGGGLTFWESDLKQFIRDCAVNSSVFSQQALYSSPDVVGYLTALPVNGLTIYYNTAFPLGSLVSCTQMQTNLTNDQNAILTAPSTPTNPSAIDAIVNRSAKPLNNSVGGVVSYTTAVNGVTSQLLGNSQNAQQFMTNMLANISVQDGVRCATAATAAEIADCNSAFLVQTGIEQENINAAGNASIFAKTAIPMMNILLALFYAFSPIVLGVALMSAAHGLKIIGGFLMFGAWTQSWMPIAAVLNFMVQEQVQEELARFGTQGITLANSHDFYNAISLKVGLASELLAMTPMISMALLSGSMMALTSVAGKFSQDRVDEKALAPDAMHTGPLTEQGALLKGHAGITAGNAHGNIVGVDKLTNADHNTGAKISFASAANQNVQESVTDLAQVATQAANQTNQALSKVKGLVKEDDQTAVEGTAINSMMSQNESNATKISDSSGVTNSMTDSQRTGFKASLSAGMNLWGTGATVEANKSFDAARAMVSTNEERKAVEAAVSQAKQMSEESSHRFDVSRREKNSTALQSSMGHTFSETNSKMDQSAAALQRARGQSQSFGTDQSATSTELATRVKGGSRAFDENARSRLSEAQQKRYDDFTEQHERVIASALGKNPSELRDEQRTDARIQALSDLNDGGALLGTLAASGAIVADHDTMHDKTFEDKQHALSPTGANVQYVKDEASIAKDKAKTARPQADQGANVRGSSGLHYKPQSDANGHTLRDKQGNILYESEVTSGQRAIHSITSGGINAEPKFNDRQAEQVAANKAAMEQAKHRSDIVAAGKAAFNDYEQFKKDHPYIAAGVEIATMVIPAGAAARSAMEIGDALALKNGIEVGGKEIAEREAALAANADAHAATELEEMKKAQTLMEETFKSRGGSKVLSERNMSAADGKKAVATASVVFHGGMEAHKATKD